MTPARLPAGARSALERGIGPSVPPHSAAPCPGGLLRLIAGLGNPGLDYGETRHNVGFMVLDRLASRHRGRGWRRIGLVEVCDLEISGEPVVLAKPQTFMNRSGEALKALLNRFPVEPGQFLIVYDEAALPFGRIRLRSKGSAGGQRGMGSVIERLGTERVHRLRVGVGNEKRPEDLSDYVLSRFNRQERRELDGVLDRASMACETWISEGIDKAMAAFN